MESKSNSSFTTVFNRLILFVFGFFLIQCVQLWLLLFKTIKGNHIYLQSIISVAYLASFCLLIWLFARILYQERKTSIFRRITRDDIKLVIVGFIMFYVISIGLGSLNNIIFNQQQTQNTLAIIAIMGGNKWTFYLLAFSATFLSPVVEELFFRGYLFNTFFKKGQLWAPVIVSGIVFSLAHASSNPISFLIYAMFGSILMFVYRRSDNLSLSIILHFLNNFIAMVFLLLNFN